MLLTLQISILGCTKEALNEQSPMARVMYCYQCAVAWTRGCPPTCVYTLVVLQVSRRGELLAAVLFLADERLLAIVNPHVNLQPLQHVEALAAALRDATELSVVPGCPKANKRVSGSAVCTSDLQQSTAGSNSATTKRFCALMLTEQVLSEGLALV